ncbi:MAG: hypothetical protein LAT81_01710 [Oceanicaulis sp.]|nr:hypothetical protein [Oceanicaulis sp.]
MIVTQTPYRLSLTGGTDFLCCMAPPERYSAIAAALGHRPRLQFGMCDESSQRVFHDCCGLEGASS